MSAINVNHEKQGIVDIIVLDGILNADTCNTFDEISYVLASVAAKSMRLGLWSKVALTLGISLFPAYDQLDPTSGGHPQTRGGETIFG